MQAFEFSTTIANGAIQLPKSFKKLESTNVRVIVLAEEPEKMANQKQKLQAVFTKMKRIKMFESIENPTAWQKQLRDEWD